MPMSFFELPSSSGAAEVATNESSKSFNGYADNTFTGKAQQMEQVVTFIAEKGFIPEALIETEVAWLYNNLGIDNMYFAVESVEVIANHIMALYAAKMTSYLRNASSLEISLEQEHEHGAVYIHNSKPGVSTIVGPQYEQHIDEKYLDTSRGPSAFRLETYRSSGVVASDFKTQLRCYFVARCNFVVASPEGDEQRRDIAQVSDRTFLSKATPNTLQIYQDVIDAVLGRTGPVIEMHELDDNDHSKRLIIGYRQGSTQKFFSAMSDLYHYYDLYSTCKYVENFSNGVTIICIYLSPLLKTTSPPIEHSVLQIMREASLIYCLPTTALQPLFKSGVLSVQETIYGYCALVFAQHFLNRLGSEYAILMSILDPKNATQNGVLDRIKKRFRQETFTREYVLDIVRQYPDLVRALFVNFAMTHYMANQRENSLKPSLSYQRLQKDKALSPSEIREKIRKTVCNQHEQMVFEALLLFNENVLKTNFYQPTKVALSFRMDPSFLLEVEYPTKPFGMFLVLGSEFRGFHLRFRDIARGGIRIIKSRNREAYSLNLRTLFDENYALASTQQRKNKDIPEGGSKGTILLDSEHQDKAEVAFQKYVDAIMDLLLCTTSGTKDRIVDRYGKPEMLFFGPDEGTADMMDWASQHARHRGAPFWKAFTTGKSQCMGGIPHDVYGMTTRSIHQYVMGIFEKLSIDEATCTKFQTGGPDGDLGSNEIKISGDKTIAIVDGSGVIYDANGIDRSELRRLAERRHMIANFDRSKLSSDGFVVLVDEHDVRLPDGTVVEDGLSYRNSFHLDVRSTADLFVPCGGRPEAVDVGNVASLLDEDGKSRFKWIVEGANLFFTQSARIRLEQAGALVFKDASANKGGVTSSSLEVLAALSLTDDEFGRMMQVSPDGVAPPFYQAYVRAVQEVIERNARLEFECLWREKEARPEASLSILSDELSYAILRLNDELEDGHILWDNLGLRRLVLGDALPPLLVEHVGSLDLLLSRLPESYLRAVFGSYLASRFIYAHGITPSQFAFFEFMNPYYERLNQRA